MLHVQYCENHGRARWMTCLKQYWCVIFSVSANLKAHVLGSESPAKFRNSPFCPLLITVEYDILYLSCICSIVLMNAIYVLKSRWRGFHYFVSILDMAAQPEKTRRVPVCQHLFQWGYSRGSIWSWSCLLFSCRDNIT